MRPKQFALLFFISATINALMHSTLKGSLIQLARALLFLNWGVGVFVI